MAYLNSLHPLSVDIEKKAAEGTSIDPLAVLKLRPHMRSIFVECPSFQSSTLAVLRSLQSER